MRIGQLRCVADVVCDAMKSGFQVTVRWRAFDAAEDGWSPKHVVGALRNEGRSECAGGLPDARDNLALHFEGSMDEFVSARLYEQGVVDSSNPCDDKADERGEARLMLQWVKQNGKITNIVAACAVEVSCDTGGAQIVISLRDELGGCKQVQV